MHMSVHQLPKYFQPQQVPTIGMAWTASVMLYMSHKLACIKILKTFDSTNYLIWFSFVSLFNGLSTFMGYLMPKPSF